MILTESQLDLLKELINIGIGRSSATLHELVQKPIKLSVPNVQFYQLSDFVKQITSEQHKRHLAVRLDFRGSFSGVSQIIFPKDSAANLVAIITGEEPIHDEFDAVSEGTLNEVANMLLNGVLGTLSNLLHDRFEYSLPTYHEDTLKALLIHDQNAQSYILYGDSHFSVAEKNIEGDITIILELGSLQNLVSVLDKMLGEDL